MWPLTGGAFAGLPGLAMGAGPQLPAAATPPFFPGGYGGQAPSRATSPQGPKFGTLKPEDLGSLGPDFQFEMPEMSEDDRISGILNQLTIFAGTMAGQPEMVKQAQQNELFRQQQRQQAYQGQLMAQIGQAQAQQQQQEDTRKLYMDSLQFLQQIAPYATSDVDPAMASALTQALMSGDQVAIDEALMALPELNPATLEGQKTSARELAEEMLAQEFFEPQAARAEELETRKKLGGMAGEAQGLEQFGATMARQKGREAYSQAAGTRGAELDVYKRDPALYRQMYEARQPQLGGGGGDGPSAYSDPFLKQYQSGRQALTSSAGRDFEQFYERQQPKGASGQMVRTPQERAAVRQQYVAEETAAQLPTFARQQAETLLASALNKPQELTPVRVITVLRDLDADPRAQRELASRFMAVARKHGRTDIVEMLEAAIGASAPAPEADYSQHPYWQRMMQP